MATQEQIRDYCEWYLTNVKSKATSMDMFHYCLENSSIRNPNSLTRQQVSAALTASRKFRNKRIRNVGYWCVDESSN